MRLESLDALGLRPLAFDQSSPCCVGRACRLETPHPWYLLERVSAKYLSCSGPSPTRPLQGHQLAACMRHMHAPGEQLAALQSGMPAVNLHHWNQA